MEITHRPKGSMCAVCAKLIYHRRDWYYSCPTQDEFRKMKQLGIDSDGMIIVKCDLFERY